MSAAVYLAHEIEWIHAKERAALINRLERRQKYRAATAAEEFDPHAATELAALIEKRMRNTR